MKLLPILFLLLIFQSLPAPAQTEGLYSGEVPVTGQGAAERESGFPRALTQVLGKLSGLRHFDDNPLVEPAVAGARSLVLAFHYREVNASSDEEEGARETHLVVQFSQSGVEELMQALALPRWPPDRPHLTVWLAIDDGVGRRIMPVEFASLRTPLTRTAEQRGLQLAWPEPDEEGEYDVDVQLLWGGYTDSIESDHVLLVAARREGVEWNARMTLEYAGNYSSWRVRNIDLQSALVEGLQHAIDLVAAASSIEVEDQGHWTEEIVVAGLNSAEDYSRSLSYLQSLSVVDNVNVASADPGRVRMVLELNASPQYLRGAISGGATLEYDEASDQYVLKR